VLGLLTRRVAAARPELGTHLAVVANGSLGWLTPVQAVATAVAVVAAIVLLPGSALVVAVIAAVAGLVVWTALGVRFGTASVLALGESRAHVFAAERTWTGVRPGGYRGPLVGGELELVRPGRVRDTWRLERRRVTLPQRHRLALEAYAS
jgi:hypothetical protein